MSRWPELGSFGKCSDDQDQQSSLSSPIPLNYHLAHSAVTLRTSVRSRDFRISNLPSSSAPSIAPLTPLPLTTHTMAEAENRTAIAPRTGRTLSEALLNEKVRVSI